MRAVLRVIPGLILAAGSAFAGEVTVAVAANAAEVVESLVAEFERESGHRVTVAVGSTGKLYAQILHGAPFDLFLAADQERPRRLLDQGIAVEDSGLTYAVGRLVLWSPDPSAGAGADTLSEGHFRRLAIANPQLAPYGSAARDVLVGLGLWSDLQSRIVLGENVGQAFAMVASGNAEFGFVALSSVLSGRNRHAGSRWEVPANLYAPIRQDAVLLERAQGNPAARVFLDYLGSPQARAVIESFGYRPSSD